MEAYISKDKTVAKYIHDDGSETAIKTPPPGIDSCSGANRNKFNVFISCSRGCAVGCKFCYLQVKKFGFTHLTYNNTSYNVFNAIDAEVLRRPELLKVPMNISWMGMGEPWFELRNIELSTRRLLNRYADIFDIEGIDIATTMPCISYNDIGSLHRLDKQLHNTEIRLTSKPTNRTNIRIFYSLHSLDPYVRNKLIPKTVYLHASLSYLEELNKEFNVIYHYMFLDGINDTDKDVEALCKFGESHNVRILRYNKCHGSTFNESPRFMEIIEKLNKKIQIKVQVSPGSEISAACGMFLMKYAKGSE